MSSKLTTIEQMDNAILAMERGVKVARFNAERESAEAILQFICDERGRLLERLRNASN